MSNVFWRAVLRVCLSLAFLLIFCTGRASADESPQAKPITNYRQKYGCHDNRSMDKLLEKAENLALEGDLAGSKNEWSKVLCFMKEPRWFPTAAMVPISKRLANLAEIFMNHNLYSDAEDLMRGAINFPFMKKEDEAKVDSASEKLVRHLAKSDPSKCKKFLDFAIEHVNGQRKTTYRNLE